MPRIELTDLERKKLSDAGREFMAKHRSAPEIEIAELKNALALARQKKTLRDEFAMAALSLVGTLENDSQTCIEDYADWAYEMADAMLKERMK